jgi:hypothetical protein
MVFLLARTGYAEIVVYDGHTWAYNKHMTNQHQPAQTFSTYVVDYKDLDLLANSDNTPDLFVTTEALDDVVRVYECTLDLPLEKLKMLAELMFDLELDTLQFDESDIPA